MATTANANAAKFEAGRFTSDTRSDCRVVFEPRSSGGIELELQSKVAAYYGNSISTDARSTLAALGIEHARLLIEDAGALPYTIAARIEPDWRREGTIFPTLPKPVRAGHPRRLATACGARDSIFR